MARLCTNCFQEHNEEICPYCGYAGEVPQDNSILTQGTMIKDRYIIGKMIGRGGFGITYLAYDTILSMKVCIKEYFPSSISTRNLGTEMIIPFTGQSEDNFEYGKKKFVDEGRTLAKFNSIPSIVTVHDFIQANGTAYIVMEYLDGIDLNTYLINQPDGKISWDKTLGIITPILKALSEVHLEGIIHRDISPDNIFITKYNDVKLLDFGTARFAFGEQARSMSIILKYGYAPPEQYSRSQNQGPWTDVYALCATIYRCLTGKAPQDSMDRVANDEMQGLTQLGGDIPEDVRRTLAKGLSVQYRERIQSAEALLDAFHGEEVIGGTKITDAKSVYTKDESSEYGDKEASKPKQIVKNILNFAGKSEKKSGSPANMESGSQTKEDESRAKKKRILYIAAGLSAALIMVLLTIFVFVPNGKYKNALELKGTGKYDKAIEIFISLDGYKDCDEQIDETSYLKAMNLREQKMYDESISIFTALGEYKDCYAQIDESKYLKAVNLREQGMYDDAILIFQDIEDYRDAAAQMDESKLQKAISLKKAKKYDEAISILELLNGYGDSKNQIHDAQYLKAIDTLETDAFGGIQMLYDVGDYKNAKSIVSDKLVELNQTTISAGTWGAIALEADNDIVVLGTRYTHDDIVDEGLDSFGNIVSVACGGFHAVVLNDLGKVAGIGSSYDKQLNVSGWEDIVAIAAGTFHTVGLRSDGTVLATGENNEGQCDVDDWENIIKIYAGEDLTIGIKSDLTIVSCGTFFGSSGTEWSKLDGCTDLAIGFDFIAGINQDGYVIYTGSDTYDKKREKSCNLKNIVDISAGCFHISALDADGEVKVVEFYTSEDLDGQNATKYWRDMACVCSADYYIIGLKSNGSIVTAGSSRYCEVDDAKKWENVMIPERGAD